MEVNFEWQGSEFDIQKRAHIDRLLMLNILNAISRSHRNFSSLEIHMFENKSTNFQLIGVVFAVEDGIRKEVMQLEIDGEFRIEFKNTCYDYR